MAVTAMWPIRGRLDQVIAYVRNPEKTENPAWGREDLQGLSDVMQYAMEQANAKGILNALEYVADESKTDHQFYVSGIRCDPMSARDSMLLTKRRFQKEGGIVLFHGYQSFKPGEQEQPMQDAGKQQERPDPSSDKAHSISEAELNEMLGQHQPKAAQPVEIANQNPTTARRTGQPPSGHTSASKDSTGRDIEQRPSVRKEIREIQAERATREKEPRERQRSQYTQHQQPKKKPQQKSKGR